MISPGFMAYVTQGIGPSWDNPAEEPLGCEASAGSAQMHYKLTSALYIFIITKTFYLERDHHPVSRLSSSTRQFLSSLNGLWESGAMKLIIWT